MRRIYLNQLNKDNHSNGMKHGNNNEPVNNNSVNNEISSSLVSSSSSPINKKELKKLNDSYLLDASKWVILARKAYTMSALHCPEMLRWKVWVAGARSEMACGNVHIAGQLLERAMKCVPTKAKAQVVLDCSRVKEFTGALKSKKAKSLSVLVNLHHTSCNYCYTTFV